jgi:signal transduction histidine kinase
MTHDVAILPLVEARDAALAGRVAHRFGAVAGLSKEERTRFETWTAELAGDVVRRGGGSVDFAVAERRGGYALQAVLRQAPGAGEKVTTIAGQLPPGIKVTAASVNGWQEHLLTGDDLAALESLRHEDADRAQAALETMEAELRTKAEEVAALHHELDETNAGLIALHKDLTVRNEELAAATAVAERVIRAREAFLVNTSHEIRTPMTAIIGFSSLLVRTDLDPKQRGFADTIALSCQHLLAVINDILDFSKVEAGAMRLESIPFDLQACVEEAIGLIGQGAADRGIDMPCDIGRDVPSKVIGDPVRVRQVLVNLLSNAAKFTQRGEVRVRVERDPSGDPDLLRLSVQDTGIGIPSDQLTLIFDEFHQADSATTREYGGTGLGLAICQRLVELMGGRIWVDSEVGKGSTFRFTLVAPAA